MATRKIPQIPKPTRRVAPPKVARIPPVARVYDYGEPTTEIQRLDVNRRKRRRGR